MSKDELPHNGMTFENLYRTWYRKMAVYVANFRQVPMAEREDIAHDVLVHVWYHLGKNDGKRPFNAWIYAVARNYLIDRIRTVRAETVSYDDSFGEEIILQESKSIPEVLAEKSLIELVNAKIDSMDDKDREIAMLVFYEQLDSKEVGRIVGKPAGTVRWRIAEIRKRLRTECREYL